MLRISMIVSGAALLAVGSANGADDPVICHGAGVRIVAQNDRIVSDSAEACHEFRRAVPNVHEYLKVKSLVIDSVLAWRNDVPELDGGRGDSYYLFWLFLQPPSSQIEVRIDRYSKRIFVARPVDLL